MLLNLFDNYRPETGIFQTHYANNKAADDLVPCLSSSLAAMVFTMQKTHKAIRCLIVGINVGVH